MTEPITASKLRELAYKLVELPKAYPGMTVDALRSAADQLDALSAKHKRAVTALQKAGVMLEAGYSKDSICDHLRAAINGVTGKCPCEIGER